MMKFEYAPGATPLDLDEANGLIPLQISTQAELNEWEAANIVKAENWLLTINPRDFLTLDFLKRLHEKMFDDTWTWAGQFRLSGRNIGVFWYEIAAGLLNLLEDVRCQIINNSFYFDEIAYRFHHRLVSIHPFPNGNGRHSRLMTDFLLIQAGQPRFTWSNQKLEKEGPMRTRYIEALRAADKGNYLKLAEFVRS
ncbi:MAG TPA: mobile mystery protein B [Gammaproteobacteria bacterium]|nr:mobile mystery protein B [Gammaproteobacteria bacterium]